MKVLRKELKVVRGTFAEIAALPTEDMTIYFCWDTKQIAVGNALGVKVFYEGDNMTRADVLNLITDTIGDQLLTVNSLLTQTNVNYINIGNRVTSVEGTVAGLPTLISEEVTNKTTEILAMIESSNLGANYYAKSEIDNKLDGYYTKLEMDLAIPDVSTFALNADLSALENKVKPFLSVGLILQDESEEEIIHSENNIKDLILSPELLTGIYKVLSTDYGPSLIAVDKEHSYIARYMATGEIYIFNSETNSWKITYDKTTMVKSVNGIEAIENDITLTGDEIESGSVQKWNNILPQTGSLNGMPYVDAINPEGRDALSIVGDGSVALGAESKATGVRSIALGNGAESTKSDAIQLGFGTNNEAGSLQFGSYKLLDSDGMIPKERLTERFYELEFTIPTDGWDGEKLYIATVPNMTADALVWVSPIEASYELYIKNRVRAISQGVNSITMKCKDLPGEPLTINIIWRV